MQTGRNEAGGCCPRWLRVLLTLLLGIIHRLYHCEYTDTDTPNDCFAVSAATGETALPKIVCLTFDDGPSKNTVPILEILDREQVPATFFVCAQDANERYLPLVADIAAAGQASTQRPHSVQRVLSTWMRSPSVSAPSGQAFTQPPHRTHRTAM